MLPSISVQSFGNELTKIAKDKTSPILDEESLRREIALWKKLRKLSPVKVKKDVMADLHGGAYFDQEAKEIGLSRNDYESLAHEIGHAELDKMRLGRVLQHPHMRTAFNMTPLAGAVAGALASRGKKLGLLLPVATTAPTIASELWATHKGKNKLKEIGATPEEVKRYKKNLNKSFVSYMGPPTEAALAGGLTYLASKR